MSGESSQTLLPVPWQVPWKVLWLDKRLDLIPSCIVFSHRMCLRIVLARVSWSPFECEPRQSKILKYGAVDLAPQKSLKFSHWLSKYIITAVIAAIIITSINMTCLNAKSLSQFFESNSMKQRFPRNPLAGWQTSPKTPRDLFKNLGGTVANQVRDLMFRAPFLWAAQVQRYHYQVLFSRPPRADILLDMSSDISVWLSFWESNWKYILTSSRNLCDGPADIYVLTGYGACNRKLYLTHTKIYLH